MILVLSTCFSRFRARLSLSCIYFCFRAVTETQPVLAPCYSVAEFTGSCCSYFSIIVLDRARKVSNHILSSALIPPRKSSPCDFCIHGTSHGQFLTASSIIRCTTRSRPLVAINVYSSLHRMVVNHLVAYHQYRFFLSIFSSSHYRGVTSDFSVVYESAC